MKKSVNLILLGMFNLLISACSGEDVKIMDYSKLSCKIDGIEYREVVTSSSKGQTYSAEWHKFDLPNGTSAYKINSLISGTNKYEFAESIYITLDVNTIEINKEYDIDFLNNFPAGTFCHFVGTTFDSRDTSEGKLIISKFDGKTMSGIFSLKLFSGFTSHPMVVITEGKFEDLPERK
ncbi:MAG: hypothetical protein JNL65_09850 [Saprospiraceae bacterium]|nr:hypothetical protein [Saprospiraceae bacterium]